MKSERNLHLDLTYSNLDWQHKGWPIGTEIDLEDVSSQGWNLFEDEFQFPVIVLNDAAMQHNIETMRRFCESSGIDLAPHGKTTMSPEISHRQLDAGAWAITAATTSQARIFKAFDVPRILIASQVVDPAGLRWAWRELQKDPNFEFICLVDSEDCVSAMERGLENEANGRPINVLVELGIEHGRTGLRTVESAFSVASRIAESSRLQLVGVEGYEGILRWENEDFTAVDAFLTRMRKLTEKIAGKGLFDDTDEVIVTAGGSMFQDRIALILGGRWDIGRPVRTVLRSGCYVTHDSRMYAETSPFGKRGPMENLPRLQASLWIWGYVLSRPEPDLALVGFGKRDVSHDVHLPHPFAVKRGEIIEETSELTVFDLNDQHAYIRLPADFPLSVGDMVGCGISHPCTTFDRWRALPLIDDEYNVIGAVRTFF